MKFHRNRTDITLDLKNAAPTDLQIQTLIKKAEAAGCFDALVRVRSEFADMDIFLDFWREATNGTHTMLRLPLGVRKMERNVDDNPRSSVRNLSTGKRGRSAAR